jgi:hypothetical protein
VLPAIEFAFFVVPSLLIWRSERSLLRNLFLVAAGGLMIMSEEAAAGALDPPPHWQVKTGMFGLFLVIVALGFTRYGRVTEGKA